MFRRMFRAVSLPLAALACLVALSLTAQAGPPLICHPLNIGPAQSLPWSGPEWRAVKADYDLNRLTDDTLALLTPETPVLVRMETLRRATVYAVWSTVDREVGYKVKDTRVARELLSRLRDRAERARGDAAALALFDLGYLAECYKQVSLGSEQQNLAAGIDGYTAVSKALAARGRDPEMEFAAALMTLHPRRATHQAHLRRAVEGAPDGSLLARNLTGHFADRGRSLTALRASVGIAQN